LAVPTFDTAMLNWGRLLLDGIPYADLHGAETRDAGVSWLGYWSRKADEYERLGAQALADGHERSAGYWLWLGSLCCQYAQFLWFDADRAAVQRRKVALYDRAAPHLAPPAVRVELPIDDTVIPGYLRMPERPLRTPVPCAVLLGGLESTKEESYLFEQLLLDRGVATFTFDGPGQGEMLEHVALAPDFERYASAVVDHLVTLPELDAERLGVLGRSLGGCYALRSASADPRFAACASWGGFVSVEWELEPPHDKASWQYVAKLDDEAATRALVERCCDVRPLLGQLRCPTYFLHGALDEVPLDQVSLLRELAVNAELTIVVEPHGDHCCHNLGPAPRIKMADWLVDRLA
jgi:2,6-dihydroxypseudooxynicotine hydrolase